MIMPNTNNMMLGSQRKQEEHAEDQGAIGDAELWPYENFDTNQMLDHFKIEADKIAFYDESDPYLQSISDAQHQHIAEMEAKLSQGLTQDRLDRIQSNLVSLNDSELTVQAVRLELAVHKLTNRGFDKLAEDFCTEYGVHNMQDEEEEALHQQQVDGSHL